MTAYVSRVSRSHYPSITVEELVAEAALVALYASPNFCSFRYRACYNSQGNGLFADMLQDEEAINMRLLMSDFLSRPFM